MGGIESKFNALLVDGRTDEAKTMWADNIELQERFRPNEQIKNSPKRDTPLHCAVHWEMRELVEEFLKRGGDPFSRNGSRETPIHVVCRSAKFSSRRSRRKLELLKMMIEKVSGELSYAVIPGSASLERLKDLGTSSLPPSKSKLPSSVLVGEDRLRAMTLQRGIKVTDSLNLGIQDKSQNTPLHLAAASGLLECVELLLARGAPLFVRNVAGQTPCGVAWESKQLIIAKLLESKMVFTNDGSEEDQGSYTSVITKRVKNKEFRNTSTLKSLRDEIVENVAEELQIAQFPAQALLMAYGWSEELAIDAWTNDREGACEKAGIATEEESLGSSLYTSLVVHKCGICDEEIPPLARIRIPCEHNFCQTCWKLYLEGQINEGAGKEIRCPEYQCYKIVPEGVIAKVVSKEQLEHYVELTVKQFADNSAGIRWCPYPDCGYAICIKDETKQADGKVANGGKAGEAGKDKTDGGEAVGGGATALPFQPGWNVECGRGHGFCWYCMKEPHEPCCCELWEKWKEIIQRMTSTEDRAKVQLEAQASAKWIIQHTKPCPNCRAPIQKSEGCNHISCKKCRYDFCWVCLDPWSLHNHRTGGYFTCNRWKIQEKANQHVQEARKGMEKEYMERAATELRIQTKKFEHFYYRYNNHLESLDIELKLLQHSNIKTRELEKLGKALDKSVAKHKTAFGGTCENGPPSAEKRKNFLEDIFRVLLHARRILSASYCIGYFIPEELGEAVNAHETLQGKLEDAVETLSEMVNREYLLTPQSKMSEAARNVDYLCDNYLTEMNFVAEIAARAARIGEPVPPPPPLPSEPRPPSPEPEDDNPMRFLPDGGRILGFVDRNGRLHILITNDGEL